MDTKTVRLSPHLSDADDGYALICWLKPKQVFDSHENAYLNHYVNSSARLSLEHSNNGAPQNLVRENEEILAENCAPYNLCVAYHTTKNDGEETSRAVLPNEKNYPEAHEQSLTEYYNRAYIKYRLPYVICQPVDGFVDIVRPSVLSKGEILDAIPCFAGNNSSGIMVPDEEIRRLLDYARNFTD